MWRTQFEETTRFFFKKKKGRKETKKSKISEADRPSEEGGRGERAALFFQDSVSGMSLVAYTTNILYSNSGLTNKHLNGICLLEYVGL